MASEAFDRVLESLRNKRHTGKGWTTLCPAHDDHSNSLSISEGDGGKVLLNCFAGCATEAVVAAAGLSMADLFPSSARVGHRPDPICQYDYCDSGGKLLYQVLRYIPKTFRQRRPGPDGTWIWDLKGVQRVLYLLPALIAAPSEQPVFVPEGEKDVDALVALGFVATTNSGGAGKWKPSFTEVLRGRHVVLLPDNDQPGRDHAEQVAGSLHEISASVKVVHLPDLPDKGDVSDWVNAGGTAEALSVLADRQSEWTRPEQPVELSAPSGEGKMSQADLLVGLVEERNVELFHDPTGTSWVRFSVDRHSETWKCESRTFKKWLAHLLWVTEHKVPDPQAINAALGVLAAKALFDGSEHILHNRVALHDDAIWYDMTDPEWKAVRITPEGWDPVAQPPILFRRYSHQRPQVTPIRGGDPRRILEFINIQDPQQQILLVIYIVSCLIPGIPHVAPILYGPQGATKTTLLRVLRRTIDPSITETLSLPHDKDQLVQQLAHHWTPYYDNLTGMPDWISDALCRAITGEGSSKREWYTDDDDIIYSFRVCLGFNGINVAAHKPDLLDRALLIGLEEIPQAQRRAEAQFWEAFEAARPAIFGGMLDALSRAMKLRPFVKVANLPRMADFTLWSCAIAEALGYTHADFMNAYQANMLARNDEVTTASPVASTVLAFMENRDAWTGTAADLLRELDRLAESHRVDMRAQSWPKAANVLSRRLNEIRPNLTTAGIRLVRDRHGKSRDLMLTKGSENIATTGTAVAVANPVADPRDGIPDDPGSAGKIPSPSNPKPDGHYDDSDGHDDTFRTSNGAEGRSTGISGAFDY
jgi:hypothetical protein